MTAHHRDGSGRSWRAGSALQRHGSPGWTPRFVLRMALRIADARIARIERDLMDEFATLDTRGQLDELETLLGSREALLQRLQAPHP